MGLFSRNKAPRNSSYAITGRGKEKLEKELGADAPVSRILMALENSDCCDVASIARSSGVPIGKVERMLPLMSRQGYVENLSADEGE